MGGQVIELECVKQWNAGKAEGWSLGREEGRSLGKEEGRKLGLAALVNTLKSIFNDFDKVYAEIIKNETYADVTREQVMKYYK